MAKDKRLRIGVWKMVFMLLITWLAQLPGLGNLIFMWNNDHYRRRSAIALGVGLGAGVIPHVVVASSFGWPGNFFRLIYLGTAIWMTFDAVAAYKKSSVARTTVATAGSTKTTTKARSKKSTRKKASKKTARKKA